MNHGGNVWRGGAPGDWLDYSANIRPEGAPEWVRRAMCAAVEAARYYPDPEMRAERAALARYLGLEPDWVLPTAGGISAIDMATHLRVEAMYAFVPCFSEYARQAANRGMHVGEISLLEGGRLLRPAEALGDRALSDSALWLCNPLNPVGAAFSRDAVEELLRRAETANAWLIVDEAFIEFCPEHTSRGLLEAHPRLMITGSMTKALGIPGVRVGYLCGRPEQIAALRPYQLSWELNCFAAAVLRALPEHARDIEADARLNRARREAMRGGLEALGARVYPSEANFLLADLRVPVAPLAARLEARRILVRDCMNFSGIDDGRHLRLAVKDGDSNARLLRELKEAMQCVGNR